MKKLFLIFIATAISLTGCQKFEDAIESLDNRVTELENTTIPTINEQIQRVNQSIADLEATDAELKTYVSTLQNTATELQKSINTTNARIDEVKIALQTEISIAKSDVLAQLEALKAETNNELAQINTTIDSLKVKDAVLEDKITALKAYVDTELGNTKDWASATFSTLEQYDSLCIEIASIKTQIESLNTSIEELEARLNDKIAAGISAAVEGLHEELAATVTEITASYVSAIGTVKIEITEAYTGAIKNAISALETSMKQWVNEQLSNYYTIAQVDALIEAQSAEFEGKLSSQKVYLESLVSSLSQTLTSKITANADLIVALRDDLSSLDDEVAKNAADIADNAEKISSNAASIIENTKAIVANGEKFEENKKAIEANAALIAENKQLIADVEAKIDNTSNAANAAAIANNAEAIAENAEILAENGLAINNNSAAIAANTSEIENLKEALSTTKSELTTAYTELINTSIATLDGKLDKSVATINSRFDTEVATINSRLETLETKAEKLESEVESIKTTITSMQSDIAEIQKQIAALLARIQSATYVPKYSDGKATMDYGTKEAELDFMISPKSAVAELTQLWHSALSVKAIYTQTRAVDFIDLPVTGFEADSDNGVISLTVSGANLSENFYVEQQDASLVLQISDGNSNISSEYVTMTPNFNIQFEDLHVKAVCCNNWDVNRDSELSYAEAASITDIGDVFKSNTNIVTFAELRHFISLTEIPDNAFSGCTKLIEIVLPENISAIGEKAFNRCLKLIKMKLPCQLISVGEYAFQECGLKHFDIPGGLTSIPEGMFYNSSLETVTIPSSIKEISEHAFDRCFNLTDVTIPEGVTRLSIYSFGNCILLNTVTLPASITSMHGMVFSGCTQLTSIFFKPTTPPSLNQAIVPQTAKIYVPQESYDVYKSASSTGWADCRSRIEPYEFK